jgi:hypothetical protein
MQLEASRPVGHRMSLIRIAVLFIVSFTLGCGSTDINAFDESAVDSGATAVVRVAPNLVVDAVDGNSRWKGSSTSGRPLTIRLPSGTHTLTLRFRQDEATDQKVAYEFTTTESDPVDLEIYVQTGHVYSVDYRDSGNGWRPVFREVDLSG